MSTPLLRRSFTAFHLVLGPGILWLSAQTLLATLHQTTGRHHLHIAALASVEALGTLLFVLPQTLRAGAALLLLTLGLAVAAHALAGDFRIDLLIYAAGVWFVTAYAREKRGDRSVP